MSFEGEMQELLNIVILEDGQTIRDTFEVERLLGEGAFAEVYRVKHRFLGRQAMKLFKLPGLSVEEVEQMLGEAVLLSRLDHPNIVRVFDANVITLQGQDFGFFTMEYVAGGSLDQFWRSFGTQFIPVATVVDIIRQVCRGLSTAHGQSPPIIHRDIKPQNILIGHEVDGLRARISDFGLAKRVNPLTLMASAKGTRPFKSPEAFRDFNSDSSAGDVWSIGTTLYLLLTDRLPFNISEDLASITAKSFELPPPAPSRVNPLCDPALDRIVMRALAYDPAVRQRTAIELLADLEEWTPKLRTAAEADSTSNPSETSKEVLGPHSPVDEDGARRRARSAVALAQEPTKLSAPPDAT